MRKLRLELVVILASVLVPVGCAQFTRAPESELVLECGTLFHPALTAEDLVGRFGAANVRDAEIHIGEGEHQSGTVLFGDDPRRRLEITWKDPEARTRPDSVRIGGEARAWRTSSGLTIGADLKSTEAINQSAFDLTGFEWDYSGSVVSWKEGRLEADGEPCRLIARFNPVKADDPLTSEVSGDRVYQSSHPAMQRLNPVVYEMMLQFPEE